MFCLMGFLSTPAIAFKNEPNGFRNVKWGSNISKLADISVSSVERDIKFCSRGTDKMAIGDAALDKILYVFYKDQFSEVMINFHSLSAFQTLKNTLVEQYGSGEQPTQFMERYFWRGRTTMILLDFSPASGKGTLFFDSTMLLMKRQARRA
jgi:hypothetical protein